MTDPVVNPQTTQEPASPVQTDNLAGLTSSDIANQIEALQAQQVSEPVPEPGINQEAAQTAPIISSDTGITITQEMPTQKPSEPVGLEELDRVRIEKELLEKRYSDSSREAIALAQKVKELESRTQQVQEQQRRYTDEEVETFVEQNPQYANWGRDYKRETIIIEAESRMTKKQEERETRNRYDTESRTALDKARTEFPEAFQPGTPMQKLAAEIYASRPSFKNDPQGVYFAAELAKARLIPASPVTPPATSQAQPTANTPFVEKGNASPPPARVDLNNLSTDAIAKMSSADMAKILPKIDQY